MRAPVIVILIFQIFALVMRSNVQVALIDDGLNKDYAEDLSYLLVPPLLAILLWPIFRSNVGALRSWFDPRCLTGRVILEAIAIGILARVVWWCQLIARVSLGLTGNVDLATSRGPTFWFECPPLQAFLVGLLVWIFLIPIVEEIVHRGLIQSSLMDRGVRSAVLLSTILFTLFHPPATMPLAFLLGLVFAIQFRNSNALWASTISHATYDGIIQLDWRCLHGIWIPGAAELPMRDVAAWSLSAALLAIAGIALLLTRTGAPATPRSTH
jgi:membrane protease YdiL (CAAX protease family)